LTSSPASEAAVAQERESASRARPSVGHLFRLALRLAIAAGLTVYILWKSDPHSVLAAAAGADWRPMAVAVLLALIDRSLMAYRWVLLLAIVDPKERPPLVAIMRIFFVSTFVGTFLPASVGGDVVRAYSIAKLNVRGGDAVASVLMDRMLGIASILVMALVGLALVHDLASDRTIVLSLAFAAATCGVTLLLVFSRRAAAAAAMLVARLPGASRHAGQDVVESIRRYGTYHGQLTIVFACSIAVQVLRIVQAYYLGRGLGIDAATTAYFAFIPLILLVMLLPVTFNGIGTSQVAFVWFFARVGVSQAAAFALSVLFVALGIVGNLPGAILYVSGKIRPKGNAREDRGKSSASTPQS
jgi:glycosyltransferase 2 family protein